MKTNPPGRWVTSKKKKNKPELQGEIALAEGDAEIRAAERDIVRSSGDAHAYGRLAAMQARAGLTHAASESTHRARMLSGPKKYAGELRDRIEKSGLHPKLARHYREALHAAHPEIVEKLNSWLAGPMHHPQFHSLSDAAKKVGHKPVHFIGAPKKEHGYAGDTRSDRNWRHLSRIHHAATEGQGDTDGGWLNFYHWDHEDHDGDSAAPERARQRAKATSATIKSIYPNAKLSHRHFATPGNWDEGGAVGQSNILIHNLERLRTHGS